MPGGATPSAVARMRFPGSGAGQSGSAGGSSRPRLAATAGSAGHDPQVAAPPAASPVHCSAPDSSSLVRSGAPVVAGSPVRSVQKTLMSDTPTVPDALPAGAGMGTYNAGPDWTYNFDVDFVVEVGRASPRPTARPSSSTRLGQERNRPTTLTQRRTRSSKMSSKEPSHSGAETIDSKSPAGLRVPPRGIEHGYQIKSDGDVKLLIVTAPARTTAHEESGGSAPDSSGRGICAIARPRTGEDPTPGFGNVGRLQHLPRESRRSPQGRSDSRPQPGVVPARRR